MNYAIVIFLVLLSGLFSGLTLGLLSLDKNELKRKIALGDKKAKKVYSVRKRGNLLLCTLLLGNVGVNSTLAIFLGNIASGVVAGFAATGLIVIFGEIIPQATFARYALQVGAKTAWLVKFFMIILSPICWPIAWVLDKALGEEMQTVYSKKELMKIVQEHKSSKHSDVDADEEKIIEGALSYSDKTAEQIMTPRTVVFALDINTNLDKKTLTKIKNEGFTRIPVYKQSIDNAVGVLYVKDLINIKSGTKVKNIYEKEKAIEVQKEIKLDELLPLFIKSKTHLALVKDEYQGLEGVVTLEDLIEEILQQEIIDETDKVADMQKKAKNKPKKP
ncbi:HlyC/CorC family transporter [Candidatus Falkowbacteria bacterium]|nr:HlyC/CorC family transporter [Candidatus Falkowbacteria bacterium]